MQDLAGSRVGTAVTAWLTALSSIEGGTGSLAWTEWLKPDAWMPVLAVLGICFIMFSKRGKKKDLGAILLGFAVLMVGMDLMSGSVSGLKNDPSFHSILTMFENPILGIFAGLILTVIVQSSSASVGILQALTVTGGISFGAAIPIIMGQNIGTCVTSLISSIGASKNAKRTAMVHLYFNVIGTAVFMIVFYAINAFVPFEFLNFAADARGIAIVHSLFNVGATLLLLPFAGLLEKLAIATIETPSITHHT